MQHTSSFPHFELELRDVARHVKDPAAAAQAFDEIQHLVAAGQLRVDANPVYAMRNVRRFELWQPEQDTWISLRWWLSLWWAERQARALRLEANQGQEEEPSSPQDVRAFDVAQYLPHDAENAVKAYVELMRLQIQGLLDVYLPAGWSVEPHRRFNVWLSHRLAPPQGERITLEEWVSRWYFENGGVE